MLYLVALLAAAAAFALYMLVERQGAGGIPLALLRALAWGAVAALLVDPALRHLQSQGPVVLLDASLSMTDASGDARWRAALDSAHAACGHRCAGRLIAFGAEPRLIADSVRPFATSSDLLPALREAAARGGPVVIVTDGEIDDAGAVPGDLVRSARVVLVPRTGGKDAGVAGLDLPASLRAGDTARAVVDVAARGAAAGDTGTLELLESGKVVARARVQLGAGGVQRRELPFVPAPVAGERETRRYEARLAGVAGDVEPRDDARATAAIVSRGPQVALISDSPDWDFRRLAEALMATSGVPVAGYVKTAAAGGGWRDMRTLKPVSDAELRASASRATLLVLHGTPEGVRSLTPLAKASLLTWPVNRTGASTGDWYVMESEAASPLGGALAGISADSLPPLEALSLAADSAQWTGLEARLERRGPLKPVIRGGARGNRREVKVMGSGLWRWASRGGAAAEAYRALVASAADWLLEEHAVNTGTLVALRDSLARSGAEFLPREPVLRAQAGTSAADAGEPVPLRRASWVYFLALAALVAEWIARRRRGLP